MSFFYFKRIKYFVLALVTLCLVFAFNEYYKVFAYNSCDKHESRLSFSLMTFNVDAYDTLDFNMEFKEKLIKEVSRQHPDVLFFQELSVKNFNRLESRLDSIYGMSDSVKEDNIFGRYGFYSHFPIRNLIRYHCEGTIDTSDFDSLELKEYDMMRKSMSVMSAEFEVQPSKWITIFSGHLRSSAYSTARRSMSKDSHWWEGIPLYYRNYKVGKRIRDYQARNVRRFIDEARAEGKTVVLAGDLNDWCGSTTLNTLMGEGENALKDAWWEGGNGFGFTYHGWHLRLRLDHILYSDGLELQDVKVIDSDLSDHRPLKASFILSNKK